MASGTMYCSLTSGEGVHPIVARYTRLTPAPLSHTHQLSSPNLDPGAAQPPTTSHVLPRLPSFLIWAPPPICLSSPSCCSVARPRNTTLPQLPILGRTSAGEGTKLLGTVSRSTITTPMCLGTVVWENRDIRSPGGASRGILCPCPSSHLTRPS